jgi:hypothetical protein
MEQLLEKLGSCRNVEELDHVVWAEEQGYGRRVVDILLSKGPGLVGRMLMCYCQRFLCGP